uniref:Uncharacterized protein n=1 Tax=Plectus sambesii TaxID=2011161 RepID=A0A914WAZ1_9BILA
MLVLPVCTLCTRANRSQPRRHDAVLPHRLVDQRRLLLPRGSYEDTSYEDTTSHLTRKRRSAQSRRQLRVASVARAPPIRPPAALLHLPVRWGQRTAAAATAVEWRPPGVAPDDVSNRLEALLLSLGAADRVIDVRPPLIGACAAADRGAALLPHYRLHSPVACGVEQTRAKSIGKQLVAHSVGRSPPHSRQTHSWFGPHHFCTYRLLHQFFTIGNMSMGLRAIMYGGDSDKEEAAAKKERRKQRG